MSNRATIVTRLVTGVLAALVLVPACLATERPPQPLYPDPEQRRAPGELARLYGGIREVDGVNVSRLGRTFSLLPGCHIIRLADVGEMNTSAGFVANVGGMLFALRMRAGHTYVVDLQSQQLTGSTGQVTVQVIERDGGGAEVARIPPAPSAAELSDCQQWRP